MSEIITPTAAAPAQAPAGNGKPILPNPKQGNVKVVGPAPKNAPLGKKAPAAKKAPAPKKAEKKAPAKREKKDGLRKPQVRILKALNAAKGPMTRAKIAEKAGVDPAWTGAFVGGQDQKKREFDSLVDLGLVSEKQVVIAERDTWGYEITAKGRKALKDAA